jgi:hypothetical protein
MPNEKKNAGKRKGLLSVEETNAMLDQELADDALKEQGSPPKSAESKAPKEPHPETVSEELVRVLPPNLGLGQMDDPCASRKEASSLPTPTNRTQPLKNS